MTPCKRCWWQEDSLCYHKDKGFKRDKHGRSDIKAIEKCSLYWNKRTALETVIPGNMLTLTSEKKQMPLTIQEFLQELSESHLRKLLDITQKRHKTIKNNNEAFQALTDPNNNMKKIINDIVAVETERVSDFAIDTDYKPSVIRLRKLIVGVFRTQLNGEFLELTFSLSEHRKWKEVEESKSVKKNISIKLSELLDLSLASAFEELIFKFNKSMIIYPVHLANSITAFKNDSITENYPDITVQLSIDKHCRACNHAISNDEVSICFDNQYFHSQCLAKLGTFAKNLPLSTFDKPKMKV